jgi:hypothetical protein
MVTISIIFSELLGRSLWGEDGDKIGVDIDDYQRRCLNTKKNLAVAGFCVSF